MVASRSNHVEPIRGMAFLALRVLESKLGSTSAGNDRRRFQQGRYTEPYIHVRIYRATFVTEFLEVDWNRKRHKVWSVGVSAPLYTGHQAIDAIGTLSAKCPTTTLTICRDR